MKELMSNYIYGISVTSPMALAGIDNLDLGKPSEVEAMEAAGQAELVIGQMLPKTVSWGRTLHDLEGLGFKFGDEVDDLFIEAQLPDGWSVQAADHFMWSDLIDEKGRRRAAVFYKAAPYDRRSHIELLTRYRIAVFHPCDSSGNSCKYEEHTHTAVAVKDGDAVIYCAGIRPDVPQYWSKDYVPEAIAWLDAHFPEWEDPLAYWD